MSKLTRFKNFSEVHRLLNPHSPVQLLHTKRN
ncbi:hypothetical protein T11_10189 [Trichinella zimbabwensis]|uniref:Uncharacterized protein n=1 Tax=Trichinella zimbabwensis TaxID=268475 RepID=A0A0V1I3Z8_9BILA|nr:hypothetical protein T11_10189 [Trichinella zimbabwensis]